MEWCEPEVLHRLHRPAVVPICVDVARREPLPLPKPLEQGYDVEPAMTGLLDCAHGTCKCDAGSDAHGRILFPQEALCLGRPGHQLAVQTDPARMQCVPRPGALERRLQAREKFGLETDVVKEAASCACVDDAARAV